MYKRYKRHKNHKLSHIAILAGGQSRRMGTNKARLLFEQQILLRRLVDDAEQQGLIPILCADDQDYPEVDRQVIASPDLLSNQSGALSAIQPALEKCHQMGEEWLWVYACDSLMLPSELFPYLHDTWQQAHKENPVNTMMILPKGEKLLPLIGLYRTILYAPLKKYLMNGHRRVMPFCQYYPIQTVRLPDMLGACCNFNTPGQFDLGKKHYLNYLEK